MRAENSKFQLTKVGDVGQALLMNFGRGFKLSAVLLGGALILTACGSPSRQYGSDAKDGVYFAVPNSWNEIAAKDLAGQEALSTTAGAAERLSLMREFVV